MGLQRHIRDLMFHNSAVNANFSRMGRRCNAIAAGGTAECCERQADWQFSPHHDGALGDQNQQPVQVTPFRRQRPFGISPLAAAMIVLLVISIQLVLQMPALAGRTMQTTAMIDFIAGDW